MTATNVYATAFVLACLFALILIQYIVQQDGKLERSKKLSAKRLERADAYLKRAIAAERERDEMRALSARIVPSDEEINEWIEAAKS